MKFYAGSACFCALAFVGLALGPFSIAFSILYWQHAYSYIEKEKTSF